MFSYDNEDLVRIVSHEVNSSGLDTKCRLRVITRISIMMRKFEKSASESYKNSLSYVFDRNQAISQLKQDEANKALSGLVRLSNLVYTIRRFDIGWAEMKTIATDFLKTAIDSLRSNESSSDFELAYLQSLALKYLCRNSHDMNLTSLVSPRVLLDLVSASREDAIKNELIWTLGHVVGSCCRLMDDKSQRICLELLNAKTNNEINCLIVDNSGISDEAKSFLLSQIEAIKMVCLGEADGVSGIGESHKPTTMINRQKESKNKKQLVVSKTIQTVKSSTKNLKCDDVQLKLLNLANALKNRSKMTKTSVALEQFPTNPDSSGDDRSMWRSTWAESLNLYKKCFSGQPLKQDDKDEYLAKKLFGSLYYVDHTSGEARSLYDFFINRMIARIFQRISVNQKLNTKTLDALMKGVADLGTVASRACSGRHEKNFSGYTDFSRAIVKGVGKDHVALAKLDGPDLLVNMFDEVKDKLLHEVVKKGWWSTYNETVPRDSYDESAVHPRIKFEIEQLRLDVVKALYNSTCRDRTIMNPERMKIIQNYLNGGDEEQDKDEETFRDQLFRIIELVDESNSGLDYRALFNTYMNALKSERKQNAKSAVNFILGQMRDPERCKQLVTVQVIDQLLALVKSPTVSEEIKRYLIEIINSYLEQEFCREGLSESHLTELISNVIVRNDYESNMPVVDGALMSILLTANKTNSLPNGVVSQLIALLNKPFGDFIVLILNQCDKNLVKEERQLEMLSFKLDSDCVVVEQENAMMKIERRNRSNAGSVSVASLAIQLVLKALENPQFVSESPKISEKTVQNLTRAAENNEDKQTKSIVFKCIYLLSTMPQSVYQFGAETLSTLQGLTSLDDYQMRVYAHAAYVRGLAQLAGRSEETETLKRDFVDSLSEMYVVQGSMKIGEKDFVPEINASVLETLSCETGKKNKKRIESEEIFQIMDEILYKNENTAFSIKVLEILSQYTTPFLIQSPSKYGHHTIPASTINSLEHVLSLVDLTDQALFALQNVITNGQTVSPRTLQLFVENLQTSPNSRRRLRAFKLLEKARFNQDLSEQAFYQLELVKAAFGLTRRGELVEASARLSMLRFILDRSQKDALAMPIDVMIALERHVDEQTTLDILANITKNGQIMDCNVINKLVNKFDPAKTTSETTRRLVEIFENVARNNQTLTEKLLSKLELALETWSNEKTPLAVKVLSIFVQRVQKGESVARSIVEKILSRIGTETRNLALKQELLSSVGSIVLMASPQELDSYKGNLQSVLIKCLTSDNNSNTQKICVSGWAALMSRVQIDEVYLAQLVEICTDTRPTNICDFSIRGSLLSLLRDNNNQQRGLRRADLASKLDWAHLALIEDEDSILHFLDVRMRIWKMQGGDISLLDQNYAQLARILDKQSPEKTERVLDLLDMYENKSQMSDELLESVALVFDSASSREIKKSCLRLLMASNKRQTATRVKRILSDKFEKDKAEEYKREFLVSSSPLQVILREQLHLKDEQIGDLLRLLNLADRKQQLMDVKSLDEFVEIVLSEYTAKKSSDFNTNLAFVFLIEQYLVANKGRNLNPQVLVCFSRIIRCNTHRNLEAVVESLTAYFDCEMPTPLLVALAECLFLSLGALVFTNPELTVRCLEFLQDNLEHQSGKVRMLAFAALALASNTCIYKTELFEAWCQEKLETLSKQAGVDFNDYQQSLDLLHVVVSLRHVDLDVFKNEKAKSVWPRELLTSNLFQQLELCQSCLDTDKYEFYSLWLKIEEAHPVQSVAFLLHLNLNVDMFKSLGEINELLFVLTKTGSDLQLNQLNVDELIVLLKHGLKQDWCFKLLEKSLKNVETYDRGFLKQLAADICAKFEASFIQKLFDSISCIDDLKAFESLLEFCARSPANILLENVRCATVSEFKSLLQVKQLCDNFASTEASQAQVGILFGLLLELLSKDRRWTLEQLNEMIAAIKQQHQSQKLAVQHTIDLLRVIAYYELSSTKFEECLKCLQEPDALKSLNIFIVDNKFHQKDIIKNAAELVEELKSDNNMDIATIVTVKEQLNQVKDNNLKSKSVNLTLSISKWDVKHINMWADYIMTQRGSDLNVVEAISVVRKAVQLNKNFNLTDIQILTSLISLNDSVSEDVRGRLLQVATGEGKSIIVVILAIVNALREAANGKKAQVDVITSSPVLAERDAKDKARLFRMFGLSVSFNNDTSAYIKGAKDCYKSDIVYGEVSQFQFDKLRDHYSQLGTLAGRQCAVAIVDEVDAMLIDDSSKIARLSSIAAGMDHFQPVYVFLWQKLLDVQRRFIMIDSRMYLINGMVEFESGKVALEYADANGDIQKILDLEEHIKARGRSLDPAIGKAIEGDLDEFLKKTLLDYLDNLKNEKLVKIPANFEDFFKKQRDKWVINAIEALNYQENVHYVVNDGQIKPVDYFSTGIVQSATSWSDGLHQFLQLKHNLKMTCETFTTNFLSNIGFISAYTRLFGLTGTLGSAKARQVLKDVYKVDMINVPQLRKKQYVEFPSSVSLNEDAWFQDICAAALVETRKGRGILIICETIEQANALNERLRARYRPSAIKLYTMNNMNQERQIEKMMPGDVVIATNLAGRGTDIHTSDIEQYGGMHVIVTFMPLNQRVQDQAFGRTARQGKLGTGQMILNMRQLGASYENVNPREVKSKRDLIESAQLDIFQRTDLKLIQVKDELFEKFCQFLNGKIRFDLRSKTKGVWKSFKELFTHVAPTVYEANVLSAIEEKWAMFLRELDDKDDTSLTVDNALEKCDALLEALLDSYSQDEVIENMYYHVIIGNDFMVNESDAKKAQFHFAKALNDEKKKEFYGSAHVGRAWSSIVVSKPETSSAKHEILDSFKKALEILSNDMALLNSSQSLLHKASSSSGGSRFAHSDLDKQLNVKTTILGSYLNSIQQSMRAVKKSLRLIDVVRASDETGITEVFADVDREHEYQSSIDWSKTDAEKEKDVAYHLTFNDLTMFQDSGDRDQACNTIDNAYSSSKLSALSSKYVKSGYEGIGLQLSQMSMTRLRALLNENKEFDDELTAKSAIAQLKQERSYWNAAGITSSYNVDLIILRPDKVPETKPDLQINAAIGIIEKETNNEQRYNLTIKKASENSINQHSLLKSRFQLAFNGLDGKSATKLSKQLSSEDAQAQANMVLKKTDLSRLLGNDGQLYKYGSAFAFSICLQENKKYQTVTLDQLKRRVDELKTNETSIEIKVAMASGKLKDLVEMLPESLLNVTFSRVHFAQLWALLCDRQELERTADKFQFDCLNRSLAKEFIQCLRKEKLEFNLTFAHLTQSQAESIIKEADLTQEAIEINKVRPLAELFMSSQIPHVELAEMAARGIEYLLEMSEKRFIPWRSVCAVAVLGTLQIVAGGILIASGFGATVGMSLISEGISDMLYAYRAYSNRQFDWGDYAKQKAVSLMISVCSMGFSKLKDAGKGVGSIVSGEASTLAQEAAKETAEAAATQFASNAKTVGKEMLKTGKNLKSLAFKFTGVKVGEAVVREGMNSGVQYLTNMSMDAIKPRICVEIQQKVESRFCDVRLGLLLRKMYALDAVAKSKSLEGKVTKIVSDAINPERSFMRKQWDSVAMPLLKGVLGTSEKYGSAISMGFRIVGTLHGLYAVQAIVDNVHEELVKKLGQIDEDSLTTHLLLEQHIKCEKNKAWLISTDLRAAGIDAAGMVNAKLEAKGEFMDKIRKWKGNSQEEKDPDAVKRKNDVSQFLTKFLDEFTALEESYVHALNTIIKAVADRITEQIVRIIDSQLISPWSTMAVSGMVDALSQRIQHHCLVNKEQNTDALNEDQKKFDDLKKRQDAGEKISDDDKKFMSGFGAYRTVGQQVNYNAQAYCLDYSQYAVKYYSSHATEAKAVSKETQALANEVRDNKPASMAEMNVLAKKLGIKLKMTNDPNYVPTPEEVAQGIKVVYIAPAEKDENGADMVGHAYFVDENGNKYHVESKPNDCFYAVVGKILETQGVIKSDAELRQMTADGIEANGNMDKARDAEKWIRERYPTEANTLLFAAGIIKLENGQLEADSTDVDDLIDSVKSTNDKDKRGGKFGDLLKKMIRVNEPKKKDQYKVIDQNGNENTVEGKFANPESNDTINLHHIIPDNQLMEMVKSFGADKEGLRKAINEYINKEHIKPLVDAAMNCQYTSVQGLNHGILLHASISWNPHNVVPGPLPSLRSDDRDEQVDVAILQRQTEDFQNKATDFSAANNGSAAFGAYGELPAAQSVDYNYNPAEGMPYTVRADGQGDN